MSIFKPDLFDTFEIKGEWWLPSSPASRVSGILSFKEGREITLETLGSIHESNSFSDNERDFPAIILGLSNEGDELTLFQNAETYMSSNSRGGTGTARYQSFYVFWGAHFASGMAMNFGSSTISYSFLEEWAGKRPFRKEFLKESGEYLGETVSYDLSMSFELAISCLDSTLRLWHGLSSGRHDDYYRKMVWEHTAHIDLESREPRDFLWHRSHIYKLRNFLTLCVGMPIHMKEVVLSISANGPIEDGHPNLPDRHIHLYFTQTREAKETDIHPGDLIITMRDIEEAELGSMLNRWFLSTEELETVHQLNFGSLRRKGMYDQLKFLSLTQALETYHRITRKGEYLPQQRYSEIFAALVPAIPRETPQDLKDSLKSRLKYGNEHSLRKRIRPLLDELSRDCVTLITNDVSSFVESVVNTRNYLTHYSDELKAGALTGAQLYNSILRLRILLIVLLFKEMGMDETKLSALLRKNQEIMSSWVTDIQFDTGENPAQPVGGTNDRAIAPREGIAEPEEQVDTNKPSE